MLSILFLGTIRCDLESTIITVALPSIQRDLGFGTADLTGAPWVSLVLEPPEPVKRLDHRG